MIHGLGEMERVLVVSPLKSMLNDMRKEMAKLRVNLAILRGGAVQHPLEGGKRGASRACYQTQTFLFSI